MNLESTEKLIQYRHNVPDNPLVSVCVQTYQHAKYIEQCLDGILMQKTSFPFEVLLGEDESTDGTREICIEYAKKHPDKIRLILHRRENVIKIGGQPTGRFNLLYNLKEARGKYIALCEGDDYWTDPYKLQKQVDFLEGNPEYTGVFHNVQQMNEKSGINKKLKFEGNVFDIMNISNAHVATCSMVFRNGLIDDFIKSANVESYTSGDKMVYYLLAGKGKLKYFEKSMAVYRIHYGGITTWGNHEMIWLSNIKLWNDLDNYFNYRYHPVFKKLLFIWHGNLSLLYSKSNKYMKWIAYLAKTASYINSVAEFKIFIKDYFVKSLKKKEWYE
ncbi:MAG: glycosyltransferase [bacterium]